MIMKRFAAAIRRQDWLAVLIEFLVVVAGIIVALQANEWAQERSDRKAEQDALQRLFQEFKIAHAHVSELHTQIVRINKLRRNAVAFVDSDLPVPENDLPLRIGINTMARFPPIVLVRVAYDELKSAGQMQLIQSAEIREQAAMFFTEIDWFNQTQVDTTDGGLDFWAIYQRHVIWDYNPDSETTDILLSTYDWEGLRADEEFIFAVIGLMRGHLVREEMLSDLSGQALRVCELLAEAVGDSCT